tara:strand:- start:3933 stop:4400 length:468 start_codon:yes stop_codon:yes gene_type:complete
MELVDLKPGQQYQLSQQQSSDTSQTDGLSTFQLPNWISTAPGDGIKQFESAGYVGRGCGVGMGMNLDKSNVESVPGAALMEMPKLSKMQMVVLAVVIAAMGYMAYTMMMKKPATANVEMVPRGMSMPVEGSTTPALATMLSNAAMPGAGINSVFS